jgi:hypothetical protein
MATDPKNEATTSNTRARVFAAVALAAFASGLAYAGKEGYRAATDSFVAPMILSPDNELVLQTKAKMGELEIERGRIVAEAESIDADLAAADSAVARLRTLASTMSNALDWTKTVTEHQASAGRHERKALSEQRAVLAAMAEKQERISKEASTNLAASLISKTDQSKEQLALHQVQLALLENDRARLQNEASLRQAYMAQRSLSTKGAAMMPEAIAREEQMVRIELEISHLESEQRYKRAEKKVVLAKLAKMDELEAQLKGRPLFRATEKSIEVAFVPYTQADGVAGGSVVYDCIWSIFHCKPVGKITEIVPGEVILPDPWGNQARGQYAILKLDEHESAKSKVLRVRGGSVPFLPSEQNAPQAVSVK